MQKSPQIIDGHGFLCGFEKENAFYETLTGSLRYY
jgi:hypothetical protein